MAIDVKDVLVKDAQRYQFLKALYEATDGDTCASVGMEGFFAAQGLSPSEGFQIFTYLYHEGLAVAGTVNGLEITHQGVREIEDSIRAPSRGTAHFSPPVIRYEFNGPVGLVQTGNDSVAHVIQNVDPSTSRKRP